MQNVNNYWRVDQVVIAVQLIKIFLTVLLSKYMLNIKGWQVGQWIFLKISLVVAVP
jgi:hypothetical protein